MHLVKSDQLVERYDLIAFAGAVPSVDVSVIPS